MQKFYFILIILIIGQGSGNAQKFLSAESIATFSAFQLSLLAGIPVQNGVEQIKIRYEMNGIDGTLDTVSGLVVLPLLTNQEQLPLIVYQHPTSSSGRNDVPSSGGFSIGSLESVAFGAFGFLVFATDYLGLGESRGFHPFVHAETEAEAGINMMYACLDYLEMEEGISWDSTNLFVAGYSQGGHASMALHRELETSLTDVYPVTAAAHMSGPYSLSEVMLEKFIVDVPSQNVADVVFMLLGYQSFYQSIFDSLSQVFVAPYDSIIQNFYEDQYALIALESQLINALQQNEDSILTKRMFQPAFLSQLNDSESEILQLIRENDTYDWAPNAPTRLYYCSPDERVPARNSTLADSVMNQNGAVDLESININASANHGDCTLFALLAAIDFFQGQITPVSSENAIAKTTSLQVFPNPAKDFVHVLGIDHFANIEIYSVSGQLIYRSKKEANEVLDVSTFREGIYYLKVATQMQTEIHPIQIIR
jgi:pimeloyl-ACP methyl ester carboxylesterase